MEMVKTLVPIASSWSCTARRADAIYALVLVKGRWIVRSAASSIDG